MSGGGGRGEGKSLPRVNKIISKQNFFLTAPGGLRRGSFAKVNKAALFNFIFLLFAISAIAGRLDNQQK